MGKNFLGSEFEEKYFKEIEIFLDQELKTGKVVYPKEDDIFKAFHTTPAGDVKVVILGQDPYHGEGQAHGLSFSVQDNMRIPPSLRNIYKEIQLEYPDFQNTPILKS